MLFLLRHPLIDARGWMIHLLLASVNVVNAFAFDARVPVKISVTVEVADVPGAIWVSFAVDHRAFATVASVDREFRLWWTVSDGGGSKANQRRHRENHLCSFHRSNDRGFRSW